MFQSERLQEKWAPLLNHEGCSEIKILTVKFVTAVLLENQEKFTPWARCIQRWRYAD